MKKGNLFALLLLIATQTAFDTARASTFSAGERDYTFEQYVSVRGHEGIPFTVTCKNVVGIKSEFKGVSPADKVFVNRRPPSECVVSRDTSKPGIIQFSFQLALNEGGTQRILKGSAIKPVQLSEKQGVQMVKINYLEATESIDKNKEYVPYTHPKELIQGRADSAQFDRATKINKQTTEAYQRGDFVKGSRR
jgi:hypothetical protein